MKIGNIARKLTGTESETSVALGEARKAWRALDGELQAYIAEKGRLDELVDRSQATKEDLKAKLTAAESDGNRLIIIGGDSPELREVTDRLARLRTEIGLHEHAIQTATRTLLEIERRDTPGKVARAQQDARQAFFRALSAHLVDQIPDDVRELIADAQMASAQGGEGLNFGPFCAQNLRTYESRQTDGADGARVAYANRLIAEYGQ
jgi:hypothetical protein